MWNFIKNLFKKKKAPIKEVKQPESEVEQLPLPIELPSDGAEETVSVVIKDSHISLVRNTCNVIKLNKKDYLAVEAATGVPWRVVAGIHYRESSLDFNCCLHNGETLKNVNKYGTQLVPKGRGKGNNWTWAEAAIDALLLEKHKFPTKWDITGQLDFAEKYNGLGYKTRGMISPYVYAGTTKYISGLFVKDGVLDKNKVDQRLGVAAIMKGLS